MKTHLIALTIATLAVGIPRAHAAGQPPTVAAKVARIGQQTAQRQRSWQGAKAALRTLAGDRALRAALGAQGKTIVLGERSGMYAQPIQVFSKTVHWGLTQVTGTLRAKVKWKEQLVLGQRGLQVRSLAKVASPTKESIRAYQEGLEAQFANGTPARVQLPDVKVEHEPFGDYRTRSVKSARLGFFGFGTRLKDTTWGHVTVDQVNQAVKDWAAK